MFLIGALQPLHKMFRSGKAKKELSSGDTSADGNRKEQEKLELKDRANTADDGRGFQNETRYLSTSTTNTNLSGSSSSYDQ